MTKVLQTKFAYSRLPIGAGDTSIPLKYLQDTRGNYITAMPAGETIMYATIEPHSPTNLETISFTGIQNDGNNQVTLTGVTRNINPQPPHDALTPNVSHGNNVEIILSNSPSFYAPFLKTDTDATVTASIKFPNAVDPQNPVTLAQLIAVTLAGAVDATTITKGVAKASVPTNVLLGTATITVATPAVITNSVAHGLIAGDSVKFTTTGALPTGFVVGVDYYVIASGLTSTELRLSATVGGSAINTTGTQSGIHSLYKTTPTFVSESDPRLPSQAENNALLGSYGTPDTGNPFVTNADTSGTGRVARQSLLDAISNNVHNGDFGDGSDGDVTVSTTITLTRDMFYNNLTVSVGGIINTANYKIYVKTLATIAGSLRNNGGDGGAGGQTTGSGGSGGGGGGGGAGIVALFAKNIVLSGSIQAKGGKGGNGGAGLYSPGGGGVVGTAGSAGVSPSAGSMVGGANGGIGGVGGANNGVAGVSASQTLNSGNAGTGGTGGFSQGGGGSGSGAGGGVNTISPTIPRTITLMQILLFGLLQIRGASGGGGGGGSPNSASGYYVGGGGGGGGGNGGGILMYYETLANTGTLDVTGGLGGTGGVSGGGSSTAGANGTNGVDGVVIQLDL